MTALSFLDFASVFVFALTGALVASRAQLDIVGFAFIACLTAVGGGTLRDLLLNRETVFWIAEPNYILVACAAAVVVFFAAPSLESRYRVLLWLDSIALGLAVATGTGVAMSLGHHPVIVVLMGICTGCFGGLMRDVVCNEVPLLLKEGEIYATAAFFGASAALAAEAFETPTAITLFLCAGVTWLLRAGSLQFGWRIPGYKPRPPRN